MFAILLTKYLTVKVYLQNLTKNLKIGQAEAQKGFADRELPGKDARNLIPMWINSD